MTSKEYYLSGLSNITKELKEELRTEELLEYYNNRDEIRGYENMPWNMYINYVLDRFENDYERYRLYQYIHDKLTDRVIKSMLNNEMRGRTWKWGMVIDGDDIDAARRAGAEDTKLALDVKDFKCVSPEGLMFKLFPGRSLSRKAEEIILEQDTKTIGMVDILLRKLKIKGNFIRKAAWKFNGERTRNKIKKIGIDTSGWLEIDVTRFMRLGRDAFAQLCLKHHKELIIKQHKIGNRGYCNTTWERILAFHPTLRVLNEDEKNELLQFDRDGVLSHEGVSEDE